MLRFVDDLRMGSGRISAVIGCAWVRVGWRRRVRALRTCFAEQNTATRDAEKIAAQKIAGFGRAKSVMLVFANGGQSQIDMWDPKPDAPLDVRGAFQPIPTSVSGVHFYEHMPRIARVADRLTVVRSMSHEDLDHGSAAYLCLTGVYHAQAVGQSAAESE